MNDSSRPSRGAAIALALCVLIFIFPPVVDILGEEHSPFVWRLFRLLMSFISAGVFCLNYFFLVPGILGRADHKFRFLFVDIVVICGVCAVLPVVASVVELKPRRMNSPEVTMSYAVWAKGFLFFIMRDGIMMVLAAALAYALRAGELRETLRRRSLELTAERRQLELTSLRAQLNPHFLFNSLNSIYVLIGISADRARSALHDLSGILRFMIQEASSPTVALSREITFIEDYIRLQSLRLDSDVTVTVNLTDRKEYGTLRIAPLLFLTLIENAFKHRARSEKGNFINIFIGVESGKVVCRVSNTYAEGSGSVNTHENSHGIGLPNISRQLELLYHGAYTCSRSRNEGMYTVELTITIDTLLSDGH